MNNSYKEYASKEYVDNSRIQADLSQNDPTAPDYVRGRTHWVGPGEINILPETVISSNSEPILAFAKIVEGNIYRVTWNGISYDCAVKTHDDWLMIGNNAIYEYDYEDTTDTGEPFAIDFKISQTKGTVYSNSTSENPSVLQIGVVVDEVVHKIDEQYLPEHTWNSLPDKPFYDTITSTGVPAVFDVTTTKVFEEENPVAFLDYTMLSYEFAELWNASDVHSVEYNGMTYICPKQQLFTFTQAIGNTALLEGMDKNRVDSHDGEFALKDTGEPFCFLYHNYYTSSKLIFTSTADRHVFKLSAVESVNTKTLDSKYIGDDIARTADVVKTVNGVEPDETGDVTIDIPQGGSGVQANLDQNDPEAPDYVKGRTHWVEEGESTVIVESQTIENFQCMNDTMYVVQDAIIMTPVIGDTYKITWDGQEYELTAKESQDGDMSYIGNDNYVNMVSGGDIPFAIIFAGPRNYVTVDSTVSDTTSHILSITHCHQIIHKIDEMYLPDSIGASGSGEGSEIFNDYNNIASGDYSHAEGYETTASGARSHAEGSSTTASKQGAHAEGGGSTASGESSHAEGDVTTASGVASHAEGVNTKATADYSHAEGASTTASGVASHAEGFQTKTQHNYNHAEGYYTIAAGSMQHVQGKYNIADDDSQYAHVVGNGESNSKRSNAHTLDWSGNAWYAGDVYVGSTSGKNKDEGSRKLIPSPTTLTAGSLLMYDGTDWVSITKEALIEEIIAALPTWTGGSY